MKSFVAFIREKTALSVASTFLCCTVSADIENLSWNN